MRNGFTLLEILTVITIIVILMGGATSMYTRYNAQKGLEKDVVALKDVLSRAREKTIARDLETTTNCSIFTGYRVRINPANSTYELYRICSGITIPVLSIYTLATSRFAGSTQVDIDFIYPYATLSGAMQVIRLNNTRAAGCHEIQVSVAGVISDQPC